MPKTSTDGPASETAPGLDGHLGFLLRVAYQKASANLARHLHGTGLSVARYAVLARLHERGALSQNRLGRLVAMEPANIHDMVRSLEAQHLVRTAPDPDDNRRRLVELTAKGKELAGRVTRLADAANADMLAALPPAERAALVRLLARFIAGA